MWKIKKIKFNSHIVSSIFIKLFIDSTMGPKTNVIMRLLFCNLIVGLMLDDWHMYVTVGQRFYDSQMLYVEET